MRGVRNKSKVEMFQAYKREERQPPPCRGIEMEMGVNSFTALRKIT